MLDAKRIIVAQDRSSRRSPMTAAEAKELLSRVERVVIARGRRRRELSAREATLDDLKGPTGSFRAPIVRIGDTLIVGFDPQSLEELL